MGNRQKHAVMMLQKKTFTLLTNKVSQKNTQSLNIVESASKSNKV